MCIYIFWNTWHIAIIYCDINTVIIIVSLSLSFPTLLASIKTYRKLHQIQVSLTSSTSSSSSVHQLQQFGVDGLPGLLQHPYQLTGLANVPGSEEGVGSALVGAAGGATDAVNVVLRRVGVVIVDDELHILHILMIWKVVRGNGCGEGKDRNMKS